MVHADLQAALAVFWPELPKCKDYRCHHAWSLSFEPSLELEPTYLSITKIIEALVLYNYIYFMYDIVYNTEYI